MYKITTLVSNLTSYYIFIVHFIWKHTGENEYMYYLSIHISV